MKRDCRICISLFLVVGRSHEGVNLKKLMYVAAAAATLLIGTLSTASAAPVYYCSNGGIDLAADGCISGDSRAYPGGGDGIYDNAGGGEAPGGEHGTGGDDGGCDGGCGKPEGLN